MTWLALTIDASAEEVEALSDALLELGALSVDIRDAEAGTEREQPVFGEPGEPGATLWPASQLTALFESTADIAAIIAAAAEAAHLGRSPGYRVTELAEQDWVRLTQSQFEPIRISGRLWIIPTWHTPPDPHATNLILDPGLAFGTGSHPTTRLCLRWLDENIGGGEDVLDYGCGSGILAIAAVKLGAASAVGIDIDPGAVDAGRRNAAQNRVEADFFTTDDAPPLQADIVLANILANPLITLAPALARATRAGGRIVLSGVLRDQADEVARAFQPWFTIAPAMEDEGWVCLEGTKRS